MRCKELNYDNFYKSAWASEMPGPVFLGSLSGLCKSVYGLFISPNFEWGGNYEENK